MGPRRGPIPSQRHFRGRIVFAFLFAAPKLLIADGQSCLLSEAAEAGSLPIVPENGGRGASALLQTGQVSRQESPPLSQSPSQQAYGDGVPLPPDDRFEAAAEIARRVARQAALLESSSYAASGAVPDGRGARSSSSAAAARATTAVAAGGSPEASVAALEATLAATAAPPPAAMPVPVPMRIVEPPEESLPRVSQVKAEGEDTAMGQRHCRPKCNWKCDSPQCDQVCKPTCQPPRCETRCAGPQLTGCNMECDQPHCAVVCPERRCSAADAGRRGSGCPLCETTCSEPRCLLRCPFKQPCRSVCEQPRCDWKCEAPRQCPAPRCRMVCDNTRSCQGMVYRQLPPLQPGEMTMQAFTGRSNQTL